MLSYRTRGNTNPAGKPKVYFACHPDDFESCLGPIAEDILKLEDCTIWYEDPLTAGNPFDEAARDSLDKTACDHSLTLGAMQLIVIPVTHSFLTRANAARDQVLPFAKEHFIPVLPVITQAGEGIFLEFNRISGGIQMLDRLDTDPTSLPYEEKLQRFLKSVLIDDTLASAVRDAFDAYVFLSYRKKDRRYANQLMSRIHEDRQYRNIAIWFDEYLVPGENFTEGIRDILKKSSLVAMAVTPNLLEPHNYVMDYEYKDAKNQGKVIVPVEMQITDHKEMKHHYKDLPEILPFENAAVPEGDLFHERFMEALKRSAVAAKEGTPEHDFYIGLAYLGGIDVEVNRERALSMITDSSDRGCMAATQKLVYMYRNGEGTERDSAKELFYQYRLADQRRAAYEKRPDVDLHLGTVSKYFRALVDLSDLLRERKMLPEGICEAEKALALYEELCVEVGFREAGRDKAVICNRLGGIMREQKMLPEARIYYRKALEVYEEMSEEMTTQRARRDLSVSYEKLGNIEKALGNEAGALDVYLKSESLRRALMDENPNIRSRRDYSAICTKLGSIYKALGDAEKAIEFYKVSVSMDEEVAAELETLSAKRDLSVSAEKLGRMYYKNGLAGKAKPLFERTVELREDIYRITGSPKHKEELEYAYHNLRKVNSHFVI